MNFRDHDKLLRHSALLTAATMCVHAANVLFQMVMMRRLPTAEYGAMAAMLGLAAIVSNPLEAARTAIAHFSARLIKAGRWNAIGDLVRRWSRPAATVSLILLVLAFLAGERIALFFRIDSPAVVAMALAGIAILVFTPLPAGSLQGAQAFRALSAMSICGAMVRLVSGALLVYCVSATALAALLAHGLGTVSGLAAGWIGLAFAARRATSAQSSEQASGEVDIASNSIGYLLNSFLILSAYAVLMTADVSLVKHFFSPSEAGLFARAATIGRSIIFLPMPIALAMFPKVVSNGTTTVEEREKLLKAMLYAAIVIVTAGAATYAFAPLIWRVFAGEWPDAFSIRLVRLIILAMAPLGLTFVVMNFELAQRRFRVGLRLLPVAAGYVAGVCLWHAALRQVIAIMGAANLVAAFLLVIGNKIGNQSDER